jgi:hypothetical protein
VRGARKIDRIALSRLRTRYGRVRVLGPQGVGRSCDVSRNFTASYRRALKLRLWRTFWRGLGETRLLYGAGAKLPTWRNQGRCRME